MTLTVHKFNQDGGQYKRSVSEGHAVCNVKENKVLAEGSRIERSNYS